MLVLDLLCNKDVILFCDPTLGHTLTQAFIDYTNSDDKTKFEFKDTNKNFFALSNIDGYKPQSTYLGVTFLNCIIFSNIAVTDNTADCSIRVY